MQMEILVWWGERWKGRSEKEEECGPLVANCYHLCDAPTKILVNSMSSYASGTQMTGRFTMFDGVQIESSHHYGAACKRRLKKAQNA